MQSLPFCICSASSSHYYCRLSNGVRSKSVYSIRWGEEAQVWRCQSTFSDWLQRSYHFHIHNRDRLLITPPPLLLLGKRTFAIIHSCHCALFADDFCTFLSQTQAQANTFFSFFHFQAANGTKARDEKENNLFGSLHTRTRPLFADQFSFLRDRSQRQRIQFVFAEVLMPSRDCVQVTSTLTGLPSQSFYKIMGAQWLRW